MRLLRAPLLSLVILAVTVPRLAFADGVLLSEATPLQREQAQSRFRKGKELMAKGKYDEAATEFRASHEIIASPNTRLELGRCLRAEGRLVAAYAEFGRTMVEAKELIGEDQRYQRAYNTAEAERAQLEPKLGFVQLTVDNPADGTRVIVGGEEVRRPAWSEPAPVEAGKTEVRVQTPGHVDLVRSVTVAAGSSVPFRVDAQSGDLPGAASAPAPAPAPAESKPRFPVWPSYVGFGVGGAMVIVAVVVGFGSVASARSNANDTLANVQNAGGNCPSASPTFQASCAKYQDDLNLISTDKTVAWTLGVTGVLVLGGSTVWFLMMRPHDHPQDARGAQTAMTLTPMLGPTLAGMSLQARF